MTWYPSKRMYDVAEFAWPVMWRWRVGGPFGSSQVELAAAPQSTYNDVEASRRLGHEIWKAAIAPAISVDVECFMQEMICFKNGPIVDTELSPNLRGAAVGLPSGKADAAIFCLHSGDTDRAAVRRIAFPGCPRHWHEDGMLTRTGAEHMQTIARGWLMGMGIDTGAIDPHMLICYPNALPGLLPDVKRPGFRHVRHIRVLQYTTKVPDQGKPVWPA